MGHRLEERHSRVGERSISDIGRGTCHGPAGRRGGTDLDQFDGKRISRDLSHVKDLTETAPWPQRCIEGYIGRTGD